MTNDEIIQRIEAIKGSDYFKQVFKVDQYQGVDVKFDPAARVISVHCTGQPYGHHVEEQIAALSRLMLFNSMSEIRDDKGNADVTFRVQPWRSQCTDMDFTMAEINQAYHAGLNLDRVKAVIALNRLSGGMLVDHRKESNRVDVDRSFNDMYTLLWTLGLTDKYYAKLAAPKPQPPATLRTAQDTTVNPMIGAAAHRK